MSGGKEEGRSQRFGRDSMRHWLNSRQNGEHCDFLHKYVPEREARVPEGVDCDDPLASYGNLLTNREVPLLLTRILWHRRVQILAGPDKCPEVSTSARATRWSQQAGEGTEVADAVQDSTARPTGRHRCVSTTKRRVCPFQTTCHYARTRSSHPNKT